MQSMTGFGFASCRGEDFHLEISIKSLNSRFLDIKFYTPSCYLTLEPELRKFISVKCRRGYFIVRMDRSPSQPFPDISLQWSKKQARQWKRIYDSLSKEMKSKNDLSSTELIRQAGVVNLMEKPQSLSRQEVKRIKDSFNQAFQACLQERKREGLILKKDILSQLRALQAVSRQIRLLSKKQQKLYMEKKNRILKKKGSFLVENADGEAEKFDTHEEIVRLGEHLRHFKRIISGKESQGKKIDFYIQEILRELNTVGAKSHLPDLTLQVVEGKSALEKIKEQVQNIE